jgi:hypothetical protein
MRRTSFVGALAAVAIGAVLAFAVSASPSWLDLQAAGVIVMIAGAADLLIRTLISDSPLLSRQAAEVAAVVEPLGDPVLDASGNPVSVANPAAPPARPPLIAPLPGTMPDPASAQTVVVADQPVIVPEQTVVAPSQWSDARAEEARPGSGAVPPPDDGAAYERAMQAAAGLRPDTPESPVAVTTLTGRPVRPQGRGLGRLGRRTRRR